MADKQNLFNEVARIEQRADDTLSGARAEANRLRDKAKREADELAAKADSKIEQTRIRLSAEYKTKTEQALTQARVDFQKEDDGLESVRQDRTDELVEWAAARIHQHLNPPAPHGD